MYLLPPYSLNDLFRSFHDTYSTSKHLLLLYSMVAGLQSKAVIDIGVGSTTCALRAAAEKIGAVVYSCDADKPRTGHLVDHQSESWKFFSGLSDDFFKWLPTDLIFDFCMHDGAHHYEQVHKDLLNIIPRMKQFGLICLHDTQQVTLGPDEAKAVQHAARIHPLTWMTMPFGCGLTIIRVESDRNRPIDPAGRIEHGVHDTKPFSF